MPADHITAFISYSHDSTEHELRVRSLADRLRDEGIEATIDQYQINPGEGWYLWMEKQIRDAKFVLLICTGTYFRRVMREETPPKGRGVMWESSIIYSYLYESGIVNERFIPLIFEQSDEQFIPVPLKPTTYYNIGSDDGYELLYRRLTNQPVSPAGPLGARRIVPPLPRKNPPQADIKTLTAHLVHPYPLESNFTGREPERRELTSWLARTEHPIFELVGLGGMGKSALCWYWVTKQVLVSADYNLYGLMWWSFYETDSSFARFVDEALRYVTRDELDADLLPTTYDRAEMLRRHLQTKRVLLVLDGFERELRDYVGPDAVYDDRDPDRSSEARACVDPSAARWIRNIAAGATLAKVLITTRVRVSDLEDRAGDALAGALTKSLDTLAPDDAVTFMRAQGVVKGTRAEIANACARYGYHPLSLRLLSRLIARDVVMPGDIAAAPRYDVHQGLVQRRHHVLEKSFNALRKRERALISRIAAFRGAVSYEQLAVFRNPREGKRFDDALTDLQDRGFLQTDSKSKRFDLHPIVRHYCYNRLLNKRQVHARLRDLFVPLVASKNLQPNSLEDLSNGIELFYHTVKAERFDDALKIIRDRLYDFLYYRLGAYQTCIELLRLLFPDGENELPRLTDPSTQAWALQALALAYAGIGSPQSVDRIYQRAIPQAEEIGEVHNVAVGWLAIAETAYLPLGRLAATEESLNRSGELFRRLNEKVEIAVIEMLQGRLRAYEGDFQDSEVRLKSAQGLFDSYGVARTNFVTVVRLEWAFLGILKRDVTLALESAIAALDFASTSNRSAYAGERDRIRAELLLGAALVLEGKDLIRAAGHLTESLTRCRRINVVDLEPDILLAWALWHHAHGNTIEAQSAADEALQIADRSAYRLKQAQIHNFLAQLAIHTDKAHQARYHIEIAKERAWCDGPPHYYKPALDEAEAMSKTVADQRSA